MILVNIIMLMIMGCSEEDKPCNSLDIFCDRKARAEIDVQSKTVYEGEHFIVDASESVYDKIVWQVNGSIEGRCNHEEYCEFVLDEGEYDIGIKVRVDSTQTLALLTNPQSEDKKTIRIEVIKHHISVCDDDMIWIDGSTFLMGDESGDMGTNAGPRHRVTITYDYCISEHEVTAGEYKNCVNSGYCTYRGSTTDNRRTYNVTGKQNHPINFVSWNDADNYVRWLGYGYRLCTEAEWEYAARARTNNKWICGNNYSCLKDIAWYGANSSLDLQHIKGKRPNPWLIYDLLGNANEWVLDWWEPYNYNDLVNPSGPNVGDEKVARGGGFQDDAQSVRVAFRYKFWPDYRRYDIGFRVCYRL